MSLFWTNTIYFIGLAALTVIQMVFALKKASSRKHLLAVYLIVAGMTFCIEATICCFLKAYNYYPMIFPNSPMDDALVGNLFSQYCLAATAMLIATYDLKYYWFFLFAGVYGIIEELFLWLGIYTHNWYRTWMSLLGFPILFWIAKKMYVNRLMYNSRLWKYFFMLFGLFALHMPAIFFAMKVSGIFTPKMQLFRDALHSYAFISLLNLSVLSFACMFIYFSKLKGWWKALLTAALYGLLYLAVSVGLLQVKDGWFLLFASIDIGGMYLCIFILDKLIAKQCNGSRLSAPASP